MAKGPPWLLLFREAGSNRNLEVNHDPEVVLKRIGKSRDA